LADSLSSHGRGKDSLGEPPFCAIGLYPGVDSSMQQPHSEFQLNSRIKVEKPEADKRVVVIDDDDMICVFLEELLSRWGMKPEVLTTVDDISLRLEETVADLYLVDIHMPGINGLDLLPRIVGQQPDSKVIMMTGYADKDKAIQSLRLGAFDFQEKPFDIDLLYHTCNRAMEALERERSLKRLLKELESNHSELTRQKRRLEHLNSRLVETNKAFSALARSMDFEREEMEKRVAAKVRSVIMPSINRLRQDPKLTPYGGELDILVSILNELASDLETGGGNIALSLSNTELRIASLIKGGLSTEEIAEHLFISPSTVRTHRKNIRRKLSLNSSSYSLKSFLLTRKSGLTGKK
jgi:FixJ family two-component response regulator